MLTRTGRGDGERGRGTGAQAVRAGVPGTALALLPLPFARVPLDGAAAGRALVAGAAFAALALASAVVRALEARGPPAADPSAAAPSTAPAGPRAALAIALALAAAGMTVAALLGRDALAAAAGWVAVETIAIYLLAGSPALEIGARAAGHLLVVAGAAAAVGLPVSRLLWPCAAAGTLALAAWRGGGRGRRSGEPER